MEKGLALQINGLWANIPDDLTISMTEQSGVWDKDAGGGFSLEFDLDLDENTHIFGTAGEVHGDGFYKNVQGMRMILFSHGMPVRKGVLDLGDKTQCQDRKLKVSMINNNLEFDDIVGKKECKDIPLLDRIYWGDVFTELHVHANCAAIRDHYGKETYGYAPIPIPDLQLIDRKAPINVSVPYPTAKYCNIRLCFQLPEEEKNTDSMVIEEKYGTYMKENKITDKTCNEGARYVVLDADRGDSGPCFYVQYFLDCLFAWLGMPVTNNTLLGLPDWNRLFFLNLTPRFENEDIPEDNLHWNRNISFNTLKSMFPWYNARSSTNTGVPHPNRSTAVYPHFDDRSFAKSYMGYLTGRNFPDKGIKDVLDAALNVVGARYQYDSDSNTVSLYLIRDVLRDMDIRTLPSLVVHSIDPNQERVDGVRFTYSGNDDDTAYSYDYNHIKNRASNIFIRDDYRSIVSEISNKNNSLYINSQTGNAYRIKVAEDATSESEQNPALFQVMTFQDAVFGKCGKTKDEDSDYVTTIDMGFTPMVVNDVGYRVQSGDYLYWNTTEIPATFTDSGTMKRPGIMKASREDFPVTGFLGDAILGGTDVTARTWFKWRFRWTQTTYSYVNWDYTSDNEHPFKRTDTGITIGLMRGPGNKSGISYYDSDYDGEGIGTSKWIQVPTDYAADFDYINQQGSIYDYNGTAPGLGDNVPVKISKKKYAAQEMRRLFPDSNPDLLNRPVLKASQLAAAGWPNTGDPDSMVTVFSVTYTIYDSNHNYHECLFTPITPGGTVLPPEGLRTIVSQMDGKDNLYNADGYRILIKVDAAESDGQTLHELQDMYYNSADSDTIEILIPSDDLENRISLKLRAEKPLPPSITPDPEKHIKIGENWYFPITNPEAAKRGIADRFYSEYAYFLMNRKTATVRCSMELADIISIDFAKRYRVGEIVGWINTVSYDLDKDGIGEVELTIYYM